MAYTIDLKTKAISLRKRGFSLKEISEKLKIAKSTASEWLTNINLSSTAQKRLENKQILGQYKSVLLKRKVGQIQTAKLLNEAALLLKNVNLSSEIIKLCCSLVWWCEGSKDTTLVRFTNSDPTLIKIFLFFLRSGFSIDESKFRAIVHIHEYHNDVKQKEFWSKTTEIPLSKFWKSYRKPHTAKRKRDNYPGCISISYYDAKIAKELSAIYNAFVAFRGVR